MLILLGMLCDAGLEGLSLIRLLDREDMETADMCEEVEMFMDRVTWLFHEGGCQRVHGHLKVVLQWLCRPHFFMYSDNKTKSIGALCTEDDWHRELQTAYAHMRAWTVLASDVLKAEFPDFSFLSAFSVFSLRSELPAHRSIDSLDITHRRKLERLAQTWGLLNFTGQYLEFQPVAVKIFRDVTGSTNLSAWRAAIERGARAFGSPADLVFVLQRFACFGASTSGIEQSFSLVQKILPACRLNAKVELDTESRLIALLVEKQTLAQVEHLCEASSKIWLEVFPGSRRFRNHTRPRLDKGIARLRADANDDDALITQKLSENRFLKRCRREVGLATPQSSRQALDHYVPETWSARHGDERQFQYDKRKARRVEAQIEGVLLPEETTAEDIVDARLESDRRLTSLIERTKAKAKVEAVLTAQPPTPRELHGATVFISESVLSANRGSLSLALRGHEADRVTHEALGNIFVVPDVTRLTEAVSIAACLKGAWVISPEVFCLAPGPALKFKPALATRRFIWASDGFKEEHPEAWGMLRRVSTPAIGRAQWVFLDSGADWAASKARAIRSNNASKVLALLSSQEAAIQSDEVKHAFDFEGLLHFITRYDRSRCTMGEGGM